MLILRREPQQHDENSPFDGKEDSNFATFQHKAVNAFQHGAAAVILVNNRAGLAGAGRSVLAFSQAGPAPISNIPFLMMTRATGRQVSRGGRPALARRISRRRSTMSLKPRSREIKGWTLTAKINIEGEKIETKNVVGVLEGAGPHANETVIIGGHYDHLGHGGLLSGIARHASQRTFTTGPTTMPRARRWCSSSRRRLGARQDPLPRRVVFMAFSGEERGLLGSQYYVKHPLIPLDETVMMINCDMVGRLNTNGELTMVGTGTHAGNRHDRGCARSIGGLEDQESRRALRWLRRQRPRVVLSQGHPGPVCVHRAAWRLPPARATIRTGSTSRAWAASPIISS